MIRVYIKQIAERIYVLGKLQRGLASLESWCERWNIKINEDKSQAFKFSHRRRPVQTSLTLKRRHIPFVDNAKYRSVILYFKKLHGDYIEIISAKSLRIFISIYPLPKSERVGTKLTSYTAVIRSILTYACPPWEFMADICLLKLLRLQNEVLHTTGNLRRCTPTRDFHVAFQILYLYDFVTKLCRQQATVTLNYVNVNIHNIGQGEAQYRKHKRLKLGGGQAYHRFSRL
jgi:hypothetical protein